MEVRHYLTSNGRDLYQARLDRLIDPCARGAVQRRTLLCAGDKRTQGSDIEKAVGYWMDYQRRLA